MPRVNPPSSHASMQTNDDGVWDAASRPLANLADPELPTDAATRAYVDAIASGGEAILVATPVYFLYDWSDQILAPPTSSQLRLDAAAPYTSAAHLWARLVSTDGVDLYWALLAIPVDAEVVLQDRNDHTLYVQLKVVAVPVDAGGYIDIGIAWLGGAGALNNNQAIVMIVRGRR